MPIKRLAFLLCAMLNLISTHADIKSIRFQHLTTENGLPKNTIDCFVQDKYGFIWIATLDGLCKFDGYKVTLYSGDVKNPHAPLNNRPTALIKDKKGQIWIAFSGITEKCKYNYETDDFTRYTFNQLPERLNFLLDRKRNDSIRMVETADFAWNAMGNVLIQTNKKDGSSFVYPPEPTNPFGLKDNFVLSVYRDEQNVLWVGTDHGGVHFGDIAQPRFNGYTMDAIAGKTTRDQTVRAILETQDGKLWMGTQNCGLVCLDRKNNSTIRFVHLEKNTNSLVENQVRSLFSDQYGFLWIGTKGGLDRYDPHSGQFRHYTVSSKHPIPDNWVFTITEDQSGTLWVGTWKGVVRYDRQKDAFGWYKPSKTLMDPNVRVVLEAHDKILWVGTEGGGFTRFDRHAIGKKRFVHVEHFTRNRLSDQSLNDDYVYCMCEDADGMLWIGTGRGLNRFDPTSKKFVRFEKNKNLADKMITGILYENGRIWASHRSGITRITCKTLETRDFTSNDGLMNNELSENACFVNPKTGEVIFGGNNSLNFFFPDKIRENPYPPKVLLTGLQLSNKSISQNQRINNRFLLEKPLYLTKKIVLKWSEKNILIEFAALHFSNPANNQYAYRLKGFDKDWIFTDARNRTASYSNLPSGSYTFMVKAANGDGVWNNNPATLQVLVLPPWWKTWWAYTIYIFLFIILFCTGIRMLLAREKIKSQLQMERLKAEKMQELEEMKSKFFTSISHEFRTPLTLIIGPVEKLIKTNTKDSQSNQYYHLIHRNAQRMLQLINQLLDLNKVESGHSKLHITNHDIVGYLQSLVSTFEMHAKDHQIRLGFESAMETFQTGFDMDKLDKILLNLISNAFKYTPDGGHIDIRLNFSGLKKEFLCIQVSDSGVGIPVESLDKIFGTYYQVDSNDRVNSSGIGLALVKELVTLHGGRISVSSTLGIGSIFILEIPVVKATEESVHVQKNQSDQMENYLSDETAMVSSGLNIQNDQPLVLIVEDNSDVREFLVSELRENFQIVQAENGKEGFEMAIELIPDLVVSDIMMPVSTGLELCEKLKQDERTSHIPVILLTALQSESSKITGFETGADAYITKPFNSSTLNVRISNLIESRQRLRSLFDKSTGYDTRVIAVNNVDKVFIDRFVQLIEENLENPSLDVEELARLMHLSRTQLYRKIKSLTDKTPYEFISTIRLKMAAEWLLSGCFTITEVSEKLGYSEPGNFSRSFNRLFGQTPKKYLTSFQKK